MESIDVVQLLSRWLHILSAVAAGGGALFMKFALHPATETLPDGARGELREAIRARWSKVVHGAVAVLLATGFYNFFLNIRTYDLPKIYHPIFGVKFLLALAVFFLGIVLVGRSELAKRMRADAGKWLTLLAALLALLILASSTLRLLPHPAKKATATTPAAVATP